MAYNIVYKKSIQHDLKKLSKAEAQRVLNQVEGELSKNADTYPVLKGQFAGLRKYRIGDYRVIYAILGNDVLVLRIGHRKDVYKKEIS
ncbi:MAG: type II toxin-antitoxin system RelE/ParE family toxin [Proteobacteria bacterium]|nr:type II toxin-antitoxin system RelE/ParE family toxin [Pseudomonadota bacterium]